MLVNGQQQTFPPITKNGCTGLSQNTPFGPYGPRGWQDEYCEWSVTRDPATNKILRVDIVCENPEYWNSLWLIDPSAVLHLYQTTLGKPQIQMADLCLTDGSGKPVVDPSTGRPAYNPLNKWNAGPVSTPAAGGAMHLTSTPNTLQTEIGLASAATIQRSKYNYANPNGLICCAQYGQIFRNSDPHIGAMVNATVMKGNQATLANPPGLYIQEPANWSAYDFPEGTASDWWTIARGSASITDAWGNRMPGNYILHVVFAPPAGSAYTVSDVKINGSGIQYGGNIIQTFQMQIVASALAMAAPAAVGCASDPGGPNLDQPLQLFHAAVFNAMNATQVANPVGQPMNLLSNSTLIAPKVHRGQTYQMVLTAAMVSSGSPAITFDDPAITAQVSGSSQVNYAVPGNSYPGPATAFTMAVTVPSSASDGLHGVSINGGPAMPALVNVAG
jgi:hypothetical protein